LRPVFSWFLIIRAEGKGKNQGNGAAKLGIECSFSRTDLLMLSTLLSVPNLVVLVLFVNYGETDAPMESKLMHLVCMLCFLRLVAESCIIWCKRFKAVSWHINLLNSRIVGDLWFHGWDWQRYGKCIVKLQEIFYF
jgi:hypothetical protein